MGGVAFRRCPFPLQPNLETCDSPQIGWMRANADPRNSTARASWHDHCNYRTE
jgi:hypothetical protein